MNRIQSNRFVYDNMIQSGYKGEGKKTVEDIIQDGINKLAQRAEREVVEYGDFAPVVEKFANYNVKDLKIGVPSIKIVYADYKGDKSLKRLELDVPSESGKSNANIVMELASKEDILKILSDKGLVERIKKNIQDASEAFEDREFA